MSIATKPESVHSLGSLVGNTPPLNVTHSWPVVDSAQKHLWPHANLSRSGPNTSLHFAHNGVPDAAPAGCETTIGAVHAPAAPPPSFLSTSRRDRAAAASNESSAM